MEEHRRKFAWGREGGRGGGGGGGFEGERFERERERDYLVQSRLQKVHRPDDVIRAKCTISTFCQVGMLFGFSTFQQRAQCISWTHVLPH